MKLSARKIRPRLSALLRLEGDNEHLPADPLRDLLEEISRGSSLNAAARARGLSWRHAWGVLNRAASIYGVSLVETSVGGRGGGGSALTDAGRDVLRVLTAATGRVESALSGLVPAGSSLEAIGSESLPAGSRLGGVGSESLPAGSDPVSADSLPGAADAAPVIFVAATLESVETGLLDAIDREFHRDTGIRIGYVAAGSGAALDLARSGRIDLAFTHAPDLEADFLAQGWGERAVPVMRSSFVIVGPSSDPARVRDVDPEDGPAEAFRRIAACGSSFVSRGDRSGTHMREVALWRLSGTTPSPPWYRPAGGSGNHSLLCEAATTGAYTLVDQATIRRWGPGSNQTVLFRDDDLSRENPLEDVFSLLRVRRGVNDERGYRSAEKLLSWFNVQKEHVVRAGAVDQYGSALFEPIG